MCDQKFEFEKLDKYTNIWVTDPVSGVRSYLGSVHQVGGGRYASHHIPIALKLTFEKPEQAACWLFENKRRCPVCNSMDIVMVQYQAGTPGAWDGASEIYCKTEDKRYGRFSGRELVGDDYERRP